MKNIQNLFIASLVLASLCCWAQQTSSGPITISGQTGTVISNLHITSTTGNCVTVTNSTNITIQNSEIGPCGTSGGSTMGNGISISGSNGVLVYDNYIHPETLSSSCCDYHDGIFGAGGNQNVTIQGNVIAYGESNMEFDGTNSSINVTGNFLLNPRGPYPRGQNFQCWGSSASSACSSLTIQNNYALSSLNTSLYLYAENQEDSINFGFTNGAKVQGNFVTGGHSASGCGIIADDTANSMQFKNNLLLNTGQCGIGIADGTNAIVDSNKIYNTNPVSGAGNTALYVWKQYTNPCGPTTVSNNIADEISSDGTHSGYWDGGGCSATISGNTFGAAADSLIAELSLSGVDLVRMDLEGYETVVIEGMQRTLHEHSPRLLVEIHPQIVGREAMRQYLRELKEIGYSPEWVLDQERDVPWRWRFMGPEKLSMDELMSDWRINIHCRSLTVLFRKDRITKAHDNGTLVGNVTEEASVAVSTA